MVVNLYSPDKSRDALFISNYANIQIKDVLTRVDGVGSITVFGSRDYAMQIWLDPDRLQSLNLTATDVTQALQAQNVQVASGVLNQPPVPNQLAFQVAVRTLGRLVRSGRVRQHRRQADRRMPWCGCAMSRKIELTAQDYSSNSYLDDDPVGRARRVPAAGLERADDRRRHRARPMEAMSKDFPAGRAIRDHLQSDRVHPAVGQRRDRDDFRGGAARRPGRHPVPADLARRGHSDPGDPGLADRHLLLHDACSASRSTICRCSGWCSAIGIVVDDAIVVVENVERNIADGLSPRDAARRTHGRGRHRADRDRAGAVRGVRTVDVHHRHFRASSIASSR